MKRTPNVKNRLQRRFQSPPSDFPISIVSHDGEASPESLIILYDEALEKDETAPLKDLRFQLQITPSLISGFLVDFLIDGINANKLLELKIPQHEMLKRDLYALRDPKDGSSLRFLPDLSRRADYLIIILEWSKPCTEADLSHILEAIPPEMRPEPNFHDSKQYYLLISKIAHNTWESISFSYNDSVPGWFRNGSPAVNMGCWFDVYGLKQLKCEPHVLFFEAIA